MGTYLASEIYIDDCFLVMGQRNVFSYKWPKGTPLVHKRISSSPEKTPLVFLRSVSFAGPRSSPRKIPICSSSSLILRSKKFPYGQVLSDWWHVLDLLGLIIFPPQKQGLFVIKPGHMTFTSFVFQGNQGARPKKSCCV